MIMVLQCDQASNMLPRRAHFDRHRTHTICQSRQVRLHQTQVFKHIVLISHVLRLAQNKNKSSEVLANTSLKTNLEQTLRLDRKLHWQFLQHFAHEAVDEKRDGFFLADPALTDVEELIV